LFKFTKNCSFFLSKFWSVVLTFAHRHSSSYTLHDAEPQRREWKIRKTVVRRGKLIQCKFLQRVSVCVSSRYEDSTRRIIDVYTQPTNENIAIARTERTGLLVFQMLCPIQCYSINNRYSAGVAKYARLRKWICNLITIHLLTL
jgi:hypothetical protein